jgi:hypothetical protein
MRLGLVAAVITHYRWIPADARAIIVDGAVRSF